MRSVPREALAAWAIACLEKAGVPHDEAKLVGESLVQTSVWGVDSHGILRLTHYLNRLTRGSIKPASVPVVTRTGPVTAQVHGQDGLGIIHATLAMETAIEMATSQVAWNKVLNARIEGHDLDPGVAVDADGKMTTNPHQARAGIHL